MRSIYERLGREVKRLREQTGISQQQLAGMISVPRPAVSQIENGERKVSAEELLKLSQAFNLSVGVLLGTEKEPEVLLARDKKTKKPEPQIRISVPQKNLTKFKEVLLHVLNRVGSKPNVGETVVYKLLYFIDFDFYEKYEEQLVGATYIRNRYGPTPVEFAKVVEQMEKDGDLVRVKGKHFTYPQRKYLPLREPNTEVLSGRELKLIDQVLNRLADMNATQISEYSHNDVPWLAAEPGKPIDYEAVFYRTPVYAQRVYEEDD